jgi:hypothetical protein
MAFAGNNGAVIDQHISSHAKAIAAAKGNQKYASPIKAKKHTMNGAEPKTLPLGGVKGSIGTLKQTAVPAVESGTAIPQPSPIELSTPVNPFSMFPHTNPSTWTSSSQLPTSQQPNPNMWAPTFAEGLSSGGPVGGPYVDYGYGMPHLYQPTAAGPMSNPSPKYISAWLAHNHGMSNTPGSPVGYYQPQAFLTQSGMTSYPKASPTPSTPQTYQSHPIFDSLSPAARLNGQKIALLANGINYSLVVVVESKDGSMLSANSLLNPLLRKVVDQFTAITKLSPVVVAGSQEAKSYEFKKEFSLHELNEVLSKPLPQFPQAKMVFANWTSPNPIAASWGASGPSFPQQSMQGHVPMEPQKQKIQLSQWQDLAKAKQQAMLQQTQGIAPQKATSPESVVIKLANVAATIQAMMLLGKSGSGSKTNKDANVLKAQVPSSGFPSTFNHPGLMTPQPITAFSNKASALDNILATIPPQYLAENEGDALHDYLLQTISGFKDCIIVSSTSSPLPLAGLDIIAVQQTC